MFMKRTAYCYLLTLLMLLQVLFSCTLPDNSITTEEKFGDSLTVDTGLTVVFKNGEAKYTFSPVEGHKYSLTLTSYSSVYGLGVLIIQGDDNKSSDFTNTTGISLPYTKNLDNTGTGDYKITISGSTTSSINIKITDLTSSLSLDSDTTISLLMDARYLLFSPTENSSYKLNVTASKDANYYYAYSPKLSISYNKPGSAEFVSTSIEGSGSITLKSDGTEYFNIKVQRTDSNTSAPVSYTFALDETKNVTRMFEYRNPGGTAPEFRAPTTDPSNSSLVSYSGFSTSKDSSWAILNLNNISFVDDTLKKNYVLQAVEANQSFDGGATWSIDTEMPINYTNVTETAVILVLDTTTSLGTEGFKNLKSYATAAIDTINSGSSGKAKIGLVAFDSTIRTVELTANYNSLKDQINNYQMSAQTRLFDAVAEAVKKITDVSVTAQSKALIVFTDGENNAGTTTESDVITKLTNAVDLKTFTIGVGSAVKPTLLKSMAINGASAVAKDMTEASSVFEMFSNAVTSVYNMTYKRPISLPVQDWIKVKVGFSIMEK